MLRRLIFAALLIALAAPALAQAPAPAPAPGQTPGQAPAPGPGRVRAQGVDVTPGAPAPDGATRQLADRAEDMRHFVENIAKYARGLNRNFLVLPIGGLDLLSKIEEGGDVPRRVPATTYMRSIDGVIAESLFFGRPETNGRATPERREIMLKALDPARKASLPVLLVEYANQPEAVEEVYQRAAELGFIAYAAPDKNLLMNRIASLPVRPFRENPHSVLKLPDVKNFVFLKDAGAMGNQAEFAMKVHDTNFDMVVVEVFHRGREALSRRAVETLRYKKAGAKRVVLAYMDIGIADSAKYYWKQEYKEGNPPWVSMPMPGAPDRSYVEFWRPEWQKIIFGDNASYIYGIVRDLGFDGVVLDGVDAYRHFDEPDYVEKD